MMSRSKYVVYTLLSESEKTKYILFNTNVSLKTKYGFCSNDYTFDDVLKDF